MTQRSHGESLILSGRLACTVCRAPLPAVEAAAFVVVCGGCGSRFARGRHWLDFTPPLASRSDSALWRAWDQLQANGVASYEADPDRNLSVGKRADCDSFARFCAAAGLVLDVGCGPQAWPAYFDRSRAAAYIGIDPLADTAPAEFLKFVGLAEFLPFRDGTFDHVLFSTTLDHFVDPAAALTEAARALTAAGEIDVWLGEKDAATPKPAASPDWYRKLEQPPLADDVFHIKRMSAAQFEDLAASTGLAIVDHEQHRIDQYRINHFFRLRKTR